MARGKTRLPINALISALVVVALVPLAILFVQLWQGMMRPHSRPLAEAELRIAETPPPADLAYPKKDEARLEADAGDGEETALPPAVATTDPVPYGAGGWNLAADETGALPLWVPPANQCIRCDPRARYRAWTCAHAARDAAEHGPLARSDGAG